MSRHALATLKGRPTYTRVGWPVQGRRVLFATALGAAAAALRVRHEPRHRTASALVHERGEGNRASGRRTTRRCVSEMGVYDDRALQEYITSSACKLAQASERPNLPWHFTSSTSRPSTRSRCPAATSTSRAASCRFSTTRRSSPACSATRSATSPRGTPRRSTRESTLLAGRLDLRRRSSCPGGAAVAQAGGTGLGTAVPEEQPRRRGAGRSDSACATRRGPAGIPRASRGC